MNKADLKILRIEERAQALMDANRVEIYNETQKTYDALWSAKGKAWGALHEGKIDEAERIRRTIEASNKQRKDAKEAADRYDDNRERIWTALDEIKKESE